MALAAAPWNDHPVESDRRRHRPSVATMQDDAAHSRPEAAAAMALNGEMHRLFRTGSLLTMFEALAVMRAAETASGYCAGVLATMPETRPVSGPSAAGTWREARESLRPFAERSEPRRTTSVETATALQFHLEHELGPVHRLDLDEIAHRDDRNELADAMRIVANALPIIADRLEFQVRRWARLGQLHASAAELPLRETRVELVLRRTDVVADLRDGNPKLPITLTTVKVA